LGEQATNILADLRARYRKITDGVKTFPRQASFKGDEVISSYTELCLLAQYVDLEDQEADHFRRLEHCLREYPIFTEFLDKVKGCGPAMSGVIVACFDPHTAKYPSSFWKYAGYDVGPDNRGRGKYKEHLVDRPYTDKDGNQAMRSGITFNPWLKTKLYVLATCLIKAKSPYSEAYYNYKNRLENHPAHKDKTKGHRHNMAMRYMIKRFLVDLHLKWRELEGLPVTVEYSAGKLGMQHG
jgi:hypothetical protein